MRGRSLSSACVFSVRDITENWPRTLASALALCLGPFETVKSWPQQHYRKKKKQPTKRLQEKKLGLNSYKKYTCLQCERGNKETERGFDWPHLGMYARATQNPCHSGHGRKRPNCWVWAYKWVLVSRHIHKHWGPTVPWSIIWYYWRFFASVCAVENERRKQAVTVCWNEEKFHAEGRIGMALLKMSEIHNFQSGGAPRK